MTLTEYLTGQARGGLRVVASHLDTIHPLMVLPASLLMVALLALCAAMVVLAAVTVVAAAAGGTAGVALRRMLIATLAWRRPAVEGVSA